MTTATQPKPTSLPAILVYGTPSGPALTQASWFRAEDKEAVKAAAKALKFSVIELQTDAEKALAAGVHEGVLKSSGRMIVGSVSAEVYRRIEEHVRKGASASDPSKPENAAAITTKPASEQTKNSPHSAPLATSKPDPVGPTDAWDPLKSVRTSSGNTGRAMARRTAGGSASLPASTRATSTFAGPTNP